MSGPYGFNRGHVVYVIHVTMVVVTKTGNFIVTVALSIPITIGSGLWNLSRMLQENIETSARLEIINRVNDAIVKDVTNADLTRHISKK